MLLLPSMMCADFLRLGEEVDELVEAGCDGFHLDVMDGHFVPNLGMGLGDVEAICGRSKVPCDVHLMSNHEPTTIDLLVKAGVQIVYVHQEAEPTINSTLLQIERLGAHPGLVVDPGVNFETVETSLPVVDYVDEKLERFVAAKEKYGYKVIIDGACSPAVIEKASKMGVDGAVLGTSAVFGKGRPYADIFKELREL